jgi:hypothetical protein
MRPIIPFPLRDASPDPARARAEIVALERSVRWRVWLWRARRRRLPEILAALLAALAACAVVGR